MVNLVVTTIQSALFNVVEPIAESQMTQSLGNLLELVTRMQLA